MYNYFFFVFVLKLIASWWRGVHGAMFVLVMVLGRMSQRSGLIVYFFKRFRYHENFMIVKSKMVLNYYFSRLVAWSLLSSYHHAVKSAAARTVRPVCVLQS